MAKHFDGPASRHIDSLTWTFFIRKILHIAKFLISVPLLCFVRPAAINIIHVPTAINTCNTVIMVRLCHHCQAVWNSDSRN